jgi:excisionase family DNA binding protein
MSHVSDTPEVLTLEEAAAYLRLPQDTIARQAAHGAIPGRQIEDTWRFLKAAIDDWLRSHDSRTLLLQQAGVLADDESLSALREAIYAARKRPGVVSAQDS